MVNMFTLILSSNTIKSINLIKNIVLYDKNMPSLYIKNQFCIENKYSMEHIFPRSFLNKEDYNDMHNIIRTYSNINNNRSNYKYEDSISNDKNWIKLVDNNYVNHKRKLFIPNECSRGFISRALLYMSMEYGYNTNKIIEKTTLINWYYSYPPNKEEIYHNNVIKELQNKNNIFISNYKKKSKKIESFISSNI